MLIQSRSIEEGAHRGTGPMQQLAPTSGAMIVSSRLLERRGLKHDLSSTLRGLEGRSLNHSWLLTHTFIQSYQMLQHDSRCAGMKTFTFSRLTRVADLTLHRAGRSLI